MTSTTIKVSADLHDKLADLARQRGTTLSGAIAYSLEAVEEAQFWHGLDAAMSAQPPQTPVCAVRDLLDPDDHWDGNA